MLEAVREKAGREEPCGVWYLTKFRGWKKKGRRKHGGSLLKRMLWSLEFLKGAQRYGVCRYRMCAMALSLQLVRCLECGEQLQLVMHIP